MRRQRPTSANLDKIVRQLKRKGGADDVISGLRTFLAARDCDGRAIRLGDTVRMEGQHWRVPWVVSELGPSCARIVSVLGSRDVPYHLLERS